MIIQLVPLLIPYCSNRSRSPGFRRKDPPPVVQQEAESTVKEDRGSPSARYRQQPSYPAETRVPPSAPAFSEPAAKGYDSLEISTSGVAKKHFDQTSMTLHTRFTEECNNPISFLPKENISVGIDRNIPGNKPAVVGGQFFSDQVIISRHRGEGEVPLHQREEFLGPQDDDLSERRVIRVAKTDTAGLGGRDNFEVRRTLGGDSKRGKQFDG
jgi:hypothetical protein